MAGDNTSPKVRMLLTIGIVAICIFVAVKFALESYYVDMTESYEHTLLPKTTEIDSLRATERDRLDKGPIPVSVAMRTLATKGRDNASPEILPQASDDPSPLIGWAQLPKAGPAPTLTPVPTAAPTEAPADAGATATAAGDAGAPHPAVAADAGAHSPPHHQQHAVTDGGH